MIAKDAEPVGNRTAYPRIDIAHIGRRQLITLKDWIEDGCGREPDPAAYNYDHYAQAWILKDG